MNVQQLCLTLPANPDTLAEITGLLAENCINIRDLTMDGAGLMRLIANDTEKARQLLSEQGLAVAINEVLVIEVPDKPGGLAGIMEVLRPLPIKVEHLSAFSRKSGANGLLIFRFDQPATAASALEKAGVRLLSGEELAAR